MGEQPKGEAMSSARTERPVRDARAFRQMSALALRVAGVEAEARATHRRAKDEPSDLHGPQMADWLMTARPVAPERLSAALDDADARARISGRRYAVVVHKRRGRRPEQAYATMTLETLGRLIADRDEQATTKAQRLRLRAMTPPHRLP